MAQSFMTEKNVTHEPAPTGAGVHVPRRFTAAGIDPLDQVRWEKRRTLITNPDGSVVFKMDGVEVPADWSQLATDIVVRKYFRKAGLPGAPGHETQRAPGRPPHRPHDPRAPARASAATSPSHEDADAFEAELAYLLVHQIGAFNSPVWFNCGLWHEYGIDGLGRQLLPATRRPARCATTDGRLLAPAVLGLLHPVGRRRPDVASSSS